MKKITSLEQIYALSDTDLKEGTVSVANITDTIKSAIKEANDKFVADLAAEKNLAASAKELEKTVKNLETKIESMAAAQAKELAEASFNARMALVDSEYNLSAEDRKAIASELSTFTDEASFEAWYGKFAIYAAAKKKNAKDNNDDDTDDDQEDTKDDSKASKDDKKKAKADDDEAEASKDDKKKNKKDDMKAAIASAVAEALKNAKASDGSALNLGVDIGKSFKEKYKGSFSTEGIVLKK